MQLDTWLIQRNIANAIRFSSIREHLRLTPMLFWFAMPVWQAFCVIQMSVAKATSCFLVRPEGLDLHFPVAPLCPYFSRLLGKVLHFASQNCVGVLRPPDQKNRMPQKRHPVFLVRPEGLEPPAFGIGIHCDIQFRHGRIRNIPYCTPFAAFLQALFAFFVLALTNGA